MLTARYGLIQSRHLRNASLISLPALRASRLVVSQSSRIFVFKSGSGRGGDGGPGRSSRVVGGDGSAMTGDRGDATPGSGGAPQAERASTRYPRRRRERERHQQEVGDDVRRMVRSVREHFGLRICNVFGIARRTLTIALNPGENPSARQGFRHDPFETWLREERPEISAQ